MKIYQVYIPNCFPVFFEEKEDAEAYFSDRCFTAADGAEIFMVYAYGKGEYKRKEVKGETPDDKSNQGGST